MLVQNVIQKLYSERDEINKKIAAIQAGCSHPVEALDKEHKSSTGNYVPSVDAYWTNFHCTLCDKKWTTTHD